MIHQFPMATDEYFCATKTKWRGACSFRQFRAQLAHTTARLYVLMSVLCKQCQPPATIFANGEGCVHIKLVESETEKVRGVLTLAEPYGPASSLVTADPSNFFSYVKATDPRRCASHR